GSAPQARARGERDARARAAALLFHDGGDRRSRPLPPVVPAHHVELGAHEVRGFRGGPVILALEPDERGWDPTHLERRVILFALRHWRPHVVYARHDHRRRGHV